MRTGRPLEYDPAVALRATMETFWQRGYDATSLHDLLCATGLSKSSFYQAFASKQGAFERALEHYCDEVATGLGERLARSVSGLDFVRDVLESAADEVHQAGAPRGCMIVNVATEFSSRDPRVQRAVQDGARRVSQVLITAVQRAQTEGSIAPQRDAHVLGRYLLSSLAGLRTMVKTGVSRAALGEIIEVILSALR